MTLKDNPDTDEQEFNLEKISPELLLKDTALGFDSAFKFAVDLLDNFSQVLYGSPYALMVATVSVLTGEHLLLEDAPGVGKTILAKAIAKSLGVQASRIQGQPDLLPSDVTGFSIFNPETTQWTFRPGPVFSQIVLCDELNRTPPRTQAALLECMEEAQVTIDGTTHLLPNPHLIIATQNPLSQQGTFPLVESQTDRFGLSCSIGYPQIEDEIKLAINHGTADQVLKIKEIGDQELWLSVIRTSGLVHVSEAVARYAVEICRYTREQPFISLGASPRAAISLINSARGVALINRRDYVIPNDVQVIATASVAHRLAVDPPHRPQEIISNILRSVAQPRP
ncbi:MAG: AAA domain-containing protein [Acidimicrobiales bacterium]|nr:AAA domain-containing protein [Acidimicrobiales bacterium]